VANPPSEHTASSTGLDRLEHPTVAGAGRVGWGFISLYTLAFISTSLLFLAPLLVTLALKVNSLVGIDQAPSSLAASPGPAPCWPWWGIRSSAS
jgi:hypothetical protein